jgi:hypothetical protein
MEELSNVIILLCIKCSSDITEGKFCANMSGFAPSNSTFNNLSDVKRRVKHEVGSHNNGSKARLTLTLYGEVLKLFVNDGSHNFTHQEFAQT